MCRLQLTRLLLLGAGVHSAVSIEGLPEPNYTCNAKRPDGVFSAPMYCTKDQGFACEVLNVQFKFPKAHVTIWNSYGCGCNWTLYNNTHWNARKRRNGPRMWTADSFVSDATAEAGSILSNGSFVTNEFDGINYRWGAELDVSYATVIKNLIKGDQPWTFSTIQRTGARVWKAGRQVYEIVTDTSQVYLMQAVSMQIDATLTTNEGLLNLLERPLPSSGKTMSLPSGWSYRCKVLAKDLVIRSNGTASIMQDEFYNNYMEENIQAEYADKTCVAETEQWREDFCAGIVDHVNGLTVVV